MEHKEKRLQEEKLFYENQIKLLESELEKQREELLTSKREAGHKLAELSQVYHLSIKIRNVLKPELFRTCPARLRRLAMLSAVRIF